MLTERLLNIPALRLIYDLGILGLILADLCFTSTTWHNVCVSSSC